MLRAQLRSLSAGPRTLALGSPRSSFFLRKRALSSTSSHKFGNEKGKNNRLLGGTVAALLTVTIAFYVTSQFTPVFNDAPKKRSKKIPVEEFVKHNKADDCWVVIKGQVYDMTEFLNNHPGGRNVIIRNAGLDVTKIFDPTHPPGIIEAHLPADKHLGEIDGEAPVPEEDWDEDEETRLEYRDNLPSLAQIQNLHDFEYLAKNILPKGAWAYYSSGADDEITMRENHYAYQRIYFRPKVLVDVSEIDTSTTLLGTKTPVPFYVSATALAKLGHPEGECSIARGAGKEGVIQMISTLASNSLEEITAARVPGATQWFQLYVNEDREMAKKMVKKAKDLGMKAIFITVDAPSLGNREKDRRIKFRDDTDVDLGDDVNRESGASAALSSFIDTKLTWDDISEIKKIAGLPIIIKGVQRVEDVIMAVDKGCQGVVISNHGGRQLDTAQPTIQVLAETISELKRLNKLRPDFEIFIDGGVRRGTDILKALAIGGNHVKIGVGMGRPFLYANSTYGEKGVRKVIQILKDELVMDMRLLGVRSIDELNESFVDTRALIGRSAPDELYNQLYSPLQTVKFKNE